MKLDLGELGLAAWEALGCVRDVKAVAGLVKDYWVKNNGQQK